MTMTPKEVVLKAFACKKADRIPVTLFGAGMWSIKDYGTSFEALAHDPRMMAEMCVAEAARIRSDVIYVGSGYNNFHASALGKAFGVGIKYREMGAPDMTSHFINSEEDLAKLDIADVHRDPVVQTVLEATRLVKATFKKPAFVEKMVDFCADLLIHVYEPLVQGGMECLSIADPTASGDLINKKQMERFAVPGLKKLTGWAKDKGAHSILHICGNTSDRLDLFPATGASTIFFDQKVDMANAKEALAGKMSFGGNVAPVHVLLNQDVAGVEKACREVIETAGSTPGFILVPGCDIPPTIPYENLKKFHDVALEWKL